MSRPLVIGSRGSKLALWQAEQAKARLLELHPEIDVRIEIIKTTGDVKTDPLSVIGGKGVFTKELEDALLDGRIDLAVHSLKDLPTILPDRLAISAIRKLDEGQYDVLILASAGLRRLELEDRINAAISTEEMVPAVGQGAIAIETRADDQFVIETTGELDHPETRLCCLAERAFLRSL